MHRFVAPLAALLLTGAAAGVRAAGEKSAATEEARVRQIREAYQAARPAAAELALFQLDWAADLKDARARAAKEKRPIFFVSTMQLKEAGDLRGGHC